jgi:DNA-binding NarL/FixJ family response regulator
VNIRVLVIADDALARAGLAMLLGGQPNLAVVGRIGNDAELDDAVSLYRPDAIVWDAGTRAPERAPDFRAALIPAVALLPDVNEASIAWNAGARGLLPREASAENLATAIGAIAQGLVVIDPSFASALFPMRESSPQPVEELTPRELQVLRLMAEGQSNKSIARELVISESTVKFHVNAILGKLNVQSRTEAVVHATRLGLILL